MEDGGGFLLFPVIALSDFSHEQCITEIFDYDRVRPPESSALKARTPALQELSDGGLHTSPLHLSSPLPLSSPRALCGAQHPVPLHPAASCTLWQPNELKRQSQPRLLITVTFHFLQINPAQNKSGAFWAQPSWWMFNHNILVGPRILR